MAFLYIGLGGNIGNVRETLQKACEQISIELGSISLVSSLYETKPVFHPTKPFYGQDNYLNAVIQVQLISEYTPEDILRKLLKIETKLGRVRVSSSHPDKLWGPRTIDLDILAIDNLVLESETLTVPHCEMHRRAFVLFPLQEIVPQWIHPQLMLNLEQIFLNYQISQDEIISVTPFNKVFAQPLNAR